MKKSDIIKALETLPEDNITIDDVVKLLFAEDLQERIKQAEEGNGVTTEEAKAILSQRLGKLWLDQESADGYSASDGERR